MPQTHLFFFYHQFYTKKEMVAAALKHSVSMWGWDGPWGAHLSWAVCTSAELRLCYVGRISRMSAEQRMLPFPVLSCLMREVLGFRYREHCLQTVSISFQLWLFHASYRYRGDLFCTEEISFPVLCLEFPFGWLYIAGFKQAVEVTKALNQDLQLGPGEPNWTTFVMEHREGHCSLSRSIYHVKLGCLLSHAVKTTERWQEGKILFCFVPVLLRMWLHNSGSPFLAAAEATSS